MRLPILLAMLTPALLAQPQAGLQAGIAKVNLEPDLGMAMGGYGARTGVAQGVLDPVQARVLALSDGHHTIALVTLDLVSGLELPEMEQIRAAVRPNGIEQVIFLASHTHSGPTYSSNLDAYRKAVSRIQQTIPIAARLMTPVRIGTGWGVAYLGHNRRALLLDGQAHMFWRDETQLPSSPVDPTVGVIRLDRRDGTPIAILVNYACHPVVLGPDNLSYSADYPSVMRDVIEEGFNSSAMAFFLQGAPGDINPFFDKTPLVQDAVLRMQETGRKLGQEVLRVARGIHTEVTPAPAIQTKTVVLHARSRWDVPKVRAVLKERYHLDDMRAARLVREEMDLPVTTLLLNHELVFVTMPGEPFVEFQMNLRARSPLPNTYLLGYADGVFGYFPTIAAALRGGYGANSTSTQVEVGTGERLVDIGLISLYDLLGKLPERPAVPEKYPEAK
jgi:neutral ceramidase